MSRSTHFNIELPNERTALIERAAAEPDGCISAGGLAHEMELLQGTAPAPPKVFGRLIEFSRRKLGWSLEQLAHETNVELVELVNIESNRDFIPSPYVVRQLAQRLGYSTERLMELVGLTARLNEPLSEAAVKFAARSELASQLTANEREAYEQFVKMLIEPQAECEKVESA